MQIALSCMRSHCGIVVPVILKRAVLLSGQFWCPAPTLVGASLRATQKKWGRGTSRLQIPLPFALVAGVGCQDAHGARMLVTM